MKKIYSFVFAAIAILSAVSCQKEMANEPLDNNGGDFTVTAIASVESKTTLVDGNKTYWTPGDKISLFNAEGEAVAFSTDITEKAASATFTNTAAFKVPETIFAVYPDRGRSNETGSTQKLTDGIINNFRIGSPQTAVAGSFDPTFGSAVGMADENGNLIFKNINSLIKFTIGGNKAPSEVKFTNGGSRYIAGLFTYNTETGAVTNANSGAKEIILKPAEGQTFEVGKTYYIAVIPGGNFANMTLSFDGTVVKTVEGAKYADGTNNYLIGKIINLGTVEFPVQTEEPVVSAIDVTRVWGHYGTDGKAWSNSLVSSLDNNDRSLAMDDQYIYIPETNTSANIHKFSITDGSYLGTLPKSTDMSLGTHYVSCARIVKKTDGSDVLLVCNLSLGESLRIFAYVNGTDKEPVTVTTIPSSRRWGDKFTVTGTWENGLMWFRSNDSRGMVGYAPLQGKYPIMKNETEPWNFLEAHPVDGGSAFDAGNISEVTWVPGTEGFCLLNTNSESGAHIMKGSSGSYTEVKTYAALKKTFGYNFFELADEKFVAYVSIAKGNGKPRLQILQSDATTSDNMVATFDNIATRLVYEAPLQDATDMSVEGVGGGNTVCDCCVREINGELYIAAIAQKAGLSLFKVSAK